MFTILPCTKGDFDQILNEIADFWGSDRTRAMHHPMLVYEFGDTAFVIKDKERVVAYLFGFYSQTANVAYVHLIGVRVAYQGRGLGRLLYEHFAEIAKVRGCSRLKAITTPGNAASIAFHQKIGMQLIGEANSERIIVVKDYSGPGQDRVVFDMELH